MNDISKYYYVDYTLNVRVCLIINNTKKTFTTGYNLFYSRYGKPLNKTRFDWLINDCLKMGYIEKNGSL